MQAAELKRYLAIGEEIKKLEAEKSKLSKLFSTGLGDAVGASVTDPDTNTVYALKRVSQDRRKPDSAKLTALLRELKIDAFKEVADEDQVAVLLEEGTISIEQFQTCLSGAIVNYVTVSLREPDALDTARELV